MKPYPYQLLSINEILTLFETKNRICYSLATGGGKTALFSFLTKQFIGDSNKRVLILAHRIDLIKQTVNTLYNIGVRSEAVTKEKKFLNHSAQVYAAMVETINNRLNKNPYFLPAIDLVIIDEAHLNVFHKLLDHFPKAKILAVTATPATVYTHKTFEDIGRGEVMEFTQKFGMHSIFENFIQGREIGELIEDGVLVQEMIFEDNQINREDLKFDEKTSDFKATNNNTKKMCVVTNYEKFCKGKKTIIFTASTKENLSILEDFRSKGYENARIFDSVNKEESGDRNELLAWYKNTPDAILINTGVFTTGFDEPTIQSVILAMSTASLAKYHQMVGRGGRSTKLIYKDHFLLIDLGGNIATFKKWSDPLDWSEHYFYTSKKLPKKEALENFKYCPDCGDMIPSVAQNCPCGWEKPQKEIEVSKDTVHVAEIIYPSGEKIVKYCTSFSKDKKFAVNILLTQCCDLFVYTEVTKKTLDNTINNGNFFKTMEKVINKQILFIENSELSGQYKDNPIADLVTRLYKLYETRK